MIIAIAVFAYLAVQVGYLQPPWKKEGYNLSVKFPTVIGLEVGAQVRVSGVRSGEVINIVLEESIPIVTMRILPDVAIREGATATIASLGLMGEKYIEISPGKPDGRILGEGDSINGIEPISIDMMVDSMNSLGKDIKAITESLRLTIGTQEGQASLASIIEHIENAARNLDVTVESSRQDFVEAMENIRAISGELRDAIGANREKVDNSIGNIEVISADLRANLPELLAKLDNISEKLDRIITENQDKVGKAVDDVKVAAAELKDTVSKVKSVASKIDQGEGTIGKLINDDYTVRKLNSTMDSLDETLGTAKRLFGRLERFRTDLGFRSEYFTDAEEIKSYVTLKFLPREDKYFLLEVVDDPFGYVKDTEITTTTTIDGSEVTEYTHQHKVESRFKITAQLAKEFGYFTLRGGLIESTGGFGVDLNLFAGHWMVSLDGFDFGREDMEAHLRLDSRIYPHRNFFIHFGWDDFLQTKQDNIYIGAGFIYTDEDIKYLLGGASLFSN